MCLSSAQHNLLADLSKDADGILRTSARPELIVVQLAEKGAIVNILTTNMSANGIGGGTSLWRITDYGRTLIGK